MNVQAASCDERRERRGKMKDLTEQVMCPEREVDASRYIFQGDGAHTSRITVAIRHLISLVDE